MAGRIVTLLLHLAFASWRWIPLACLAALLLAAAWAVRSLEVDPSNESLNVPDAHRLATLERFHALFGSDEDLLIAWRDTELATPAGLSRVAELTTELRQIPGVTAVFSLTNALQVVPGETGAELKPLVAPPYDRPTVRHELEVAVQRMPEFVGWLISPDLTVTAVWLTLSEESARPQHAARTIEAVRAAVDHLRRHGLVAHLTGVPVQKYEVTAYIQRDERLLLPLAVVVLGSVLWLHFHRIGAVILPLAVAGMTVLIVHAGLALCGIRLNAITSLLPPILLVLALTPCIHLLHFWFRADAPLEPRERTRAMLDHLLWRCVLCAATTACGFAALAISPMPAVREFGLAAAFGSLVGFALALWLVPLGSQVLFAPTPTTMSTRANQRNSLHPFLHLCGRLSIHWPWTTLITALVCGVALSVGIGLLRNNTDLVRFLKPGAPLREDTFWIDRHLGGPYPLEFLIERRDGLRLAHASDWQRIAAWAQASREIPTVGGVLSLADLLRHVHAAEYGLNRATLPTEDDVVEELLDFLAVVPDQPLVRRLISPEQTVARIQVRLRAVGTADVVATAERLMNLAQLHLGPTYEFRPTGPLYYLARDSNQLVRQQLQSFAVSFVLVGLLMALSVGSVRIGAVALVPNILPIAMTAGLLGFLGIDLSTGTAMIAAAAMGLVVDDTIHYIGAFRQNLRRNEGPFEAARRTTLETGPALVANNLVLVAGFWVGVAGSFLPTIYFSLFTGVALILALLCDLLVTPACLVLLTRR
ncbi:hypothetical protein HRbin30_02868 [bacterium HR30]|nr:hypothetical protein HRbin30_02868 [bacterium HR30]